jgi:predicted membrane-bound spermidine synthase
MGFLMLMVAAIWTATVAAILLPAPVLLIGKGSAGGVVSSLSVTCLFIALGTGFMFLEMGFIQIFTRFLGDPILAAAIVIGGLLFFAGLGSLCQQTLTGETAERIFLVTAAITILVITYASVFPWIFQTAGFLSDMPRIGLSLALIAPLAFLMGMPFPWGISLLHRRAAAAVPVAWAVNGFASVVSTAGAVLVAMVYGFSWLLTFAAGLYLLAGIICLVLYRRA